MLQITKALTKDGRSNERLSMQAREHPCPPGTGFCGGRNHGLRGAGDMAQRLRELNALRKDLRSIPSNHTELPLCDIGSLDC